MSWRRPREGTVAGDGMVSSRGGGRGFSWWVLGAQQMQTKTSKQPIVSTPLGKSPSSFLSSHPATEAGEGPFCSVAHCQYCREAWGQCVLVVLPGSHGRFNNCYGYRVCEGAHCIHCGGITNGDGQHRLC